MDFVTFGQSKASCFNASLNAKISLPTACSNYIFIVHYIRVVSILSSNSH